MAIPDLTIIVPTYNLGRYLPATLKRIQQQTIDVELWLIDDASIITQPPFPITKVSAPHAILVLTMRLGGSLRLSMVMI